MQSYSIRYISHLIQGSLQRHSVINPRQYLPNFFSMPPLNTYLYPLSHHLLPREDFIARISPIPLPRERHYLSAHSSQRLISNKLFSERYLPHTKKNYSFFHFFQLYLPVVNKNNYSRPKRAPGSSLSSGGNVL